MELLKIKFGKFLLALLLLGFSVAVIPQNMQQLQKDPFSMSVYTAVDELGKRYPNERFSVYKCFKEYKAVYNAKAYALLIALTYRDRLSDNGRKLAIQSDCPDLQTLTEKKQMPLVSPAINELGIVDISSIPKEMLQKNNWKQVTMRSIYDEYARWWFILQP